MSVLGHLLWAFLGLSPLLSGFPGLGQWSWCQCASSNHLWTTTKRGRDRTEKRKRCKKHGDFCQKTCCQDFVMKFYNCGKKMKVPIVQEFTADPRLTMICQNEAPWCISKWRKRTGTWYLPGSTHEHTTMYWIFDFSTETFMLIDFDFVTDFEQSCGSWIWSLEPSLFS